MAMIVWYFYLHPIMKSVPITLCTSKVMSLIPAHFTYTVLMQPFWKETKFVYDFPRNSIFSGEDCSRTREGKMLKDIQISFLPNGLTYKLQTLHLQKERPFCLYKKYKTFIYTFYRMSWIVVSEILDLGY